LQESKLNRVDSGRDRSVGIVVRSQAGESKIRALSREKKIIIYR
jgi:hypothetical protein